MRFYRESQGVSPVLHTVHGLQATPWSSQYDMHRSTINLLSVIPLSAGDGMSYRRHYPHT